MNKWARAAFKAGLTVAAIHSVNKTIEALADARQPEAAGEGFYKFETKYGVMRYIKKGHGAPLVLLHNLHGPQGVTEWNRNIGILSNNYTVYAPEFLGYGYSDKPKVTYSAYMFASILNRFLKNTVGEPAYIAANGESAGIALAACALDRSYFRKIMMVSPTGAGTLNLPASNITNRAFLVPILGTALYNAIHSKAISSYLLKKVYFDKTSVTGELRDGSYLAAHKDTCGAKHAFAAAMSNLFTSDIARLVHGATVPLHVVWGGGDRLNPISNYEPLAAAGGGNISLTIFEDVKQYPHYDNPSAFYKVCRQFFRDILL